MFSLLTFLIRIFFNLFRTGKELLIQNCFQKKELEILKRKNQRKKLKLYHSDRIIFSILAQIGNIKGTISTVKAETVLGWQRELIRRFWTYRTKSRIGRPPVQNEIKQLILNMKNENLYWGYKKIQGELLKLGITLDQKAIRNIIADFRRRGKIKQYLTWKQFLRPQIHSIDAMDFFTIDTVLDQRCYVFFIMYHKTREIVQFAVTRNPMREFVRQQLMVFENRLNNVVYLIHDRAAQFDLDYFAYGIKEVKISVNAPNMNAFAERFVGSVRREVLDYFLLISETQVIKILQEYVDYYNSKRPHQGIDQQMPNGYKAQTNGRVLKFPILGGLCYHYMRRVA